uniref:Uncharacterized protein n=1 Tax=Arundo donax TaxID=35708 RepID=A0A0A9HDR7_ARUDO
MKEVKFIYKARQNPN